MYRFLNYGLLIFPATLILMGSTLRATANSNELFTPYREQIQTKLPSGLQMRLPSESLLDNVIESSYLVQVFVLDDSSSLLVGLFKCDTGVSSCQVGSFSVDSKTSIIAQQAYLQHQAAAAPITLDQDIQGYLLDGNKQDPSSQFSSVMWEQDGQFYTVRFLAQERQKLLYLAQSMAQSEPISNISETVAEVNELEVSFLPASPPITVNNELQRGSPTTETTNDAVSKNPEPPDTEAQEELISEPNNPKKESCSFQPKPAKEAKEITLPLQSEDNTINIKVIGSTVFESDDLLINDAIQRKLQEIQDQNFTQGTFQKKLKELAQAISSFYVEKGYINSNAEVASTNLENKTGEIAVTEGRLAEIIVTNRGRLNLSYICNRIKLGIDTPLNTNQLEGQLRLLRINPLFDEVEARLEKTGQPGQSRLMVIVDEANSWIGSVSVDNYSPPSVGSERVGASLGYLNLTGLGDQLSGSYFHSFTGGVDLFDFTYRVPLNAMNGTIQLRAAPSRNEITQPPFDEFEIQGEKELYELLYRQPLIRKFQEEFALSVGFTFQDGQTFVFDQPNSFGFGPDQDGVSRTSVIKFAQDYLRRDSSGVWSIRSFFNFGTGLFNATLNDAPVPDGQFFSWLAQVQRLQFLSKDNVLIIQGDLQLTPNSLLPSQQFVIGGGQSLRGYRQSVRSGDNGFRFSIEDRITILKNKEGNSAIQVAPFLDMGSVWNVSDNPNQLLDQTFLIGVGLGLLLQPFDGFHIRLDYGYPFIDLDDRGENAQDDGFYFQVIYQP